MVAESCDLVVVGTGKIPCLFDESYLTYFKGGQVSQPPTPTLLFTQNTTSLFSKPIRASVESGPQSAYIQISNQTT
jgi:hypothetical protein